MQGPDWQIGRILGIPIRVHASWLLVFLFVTWTLATGYLPDQLPGLSPLRYWAMGAIAALLLFVSVLLHELGHSYVALKYRIPIGQITLFIFGGVAHMRKEPPSPRAEFLIAIAGPIVSFLLAGICLGFVALVEIIPAGNAFRGLVALTALLGMVNTQLGLFNLIPGYPLDGGRALRAGLWAWTNDFYRATSQAAFVGLVFGLGFGLMGAHAYRRSAFRNIIEFGGEQRRMDCSDRRLPLCCRAGEPQTGSGAGIPGICPRAGINGPSGGVVAA